MIKLNSRSTNRLAELVRAPSRRSDTGATSARGMMSDDALTVAIGLVVEPGEDLRAPVADAAADAEAARAGAEVAPVVQGRDRDADNVGDFLHGQQFVVGVRGVGHSGPLGATHGVPPGEEALTEAESLRRFSLRPPNGHFAV